MYVNVTLPYFCMVRTVQPMLDKPPDDLVWFIQLKCAVNASSSLRHQLSALRAHAEWMSSARCLQDGRLLACRIPRCGWCFDPHQADALPTEQASAVQCL